MSRFAGLKQTTSAVVAEPAPVAAVRAAVVERKPKNPREGKKAVVGYFSPAVSKGLRQLALDQSTSVQGLLGEAIDDLMRKYGGHPFGER